MKYREITLKDAPSIFDLRVATNESNFTYEEIEARGITYKLLEKQLLNNCKGWLCESNNYIIGFVIVDKNAAKIWALEVLPVHNKQQIRTHLLNLAEHWLLSCGKANFWHTKKSVSHKVDALSVA